MYTRFRVWDGKKMWYPEGDHMYAITAHGIVLQYREDAWGARYHPVPSYRHTLSTGLKDKNGKEIWEGDIVEVKGNAAQSYVGETTVLSSFYVIKVQVMAREDTEEQWEKEKSEYECIGNKYENPELLKEVA